MRLLTVFLAIVTTSALSMASHEDLEDSSSPSKDLPTAESLDNDARGAKIFAYYISTTTTRLSISTTKALSTCLSSTAGAKPCRRLKRRANVLGPVDENSDLDLDGTLVPAEALEEVKPAVDRKGKNITIWKTRFTTLVLTTTSYIPLTTVSVSAHCITPGFMNFCFGK